MTSDDDFLLNEDNSALSQQEARGFTPEQMVRCEECLRANPPTRAGCLYCGAALPVTEQSAAMLKPTLKPLEQWEKGFNCIFIPTRDAGFKADHYREAASLLNLPIEEVRRIVESAECLPIARVATAGEASLIERRLAELGARILSVSDEELALDSQPPKRIRSLELTEDSLVAFQTGSNERLRASWNDVALIVSGRIVARQIEVEERRGRKTENEIIETRELSTDDALLDIYSSSHEGGWRIIAGNFDFSCLGEKKSLLVAQNFASLLDELRTRAGNAEYDDSYHRVRRSLSAIWPLEQQTESRGWRRGGPGRFSTEIVSTSDNERQFTRYSRLRYYLKSRGTDVSL